MLCSACRGQCQHVVVTLHRMRSTVSPHAALPHSCLLQAAAAGLRQHHHRLLPGPRHQRRRWGGEGGLWLLRAGVCGSMHCVCCSAAESRPHEHVISSCPSLPSPAAESKRVSVGLTMITCPAVLLCDEPTSGLDSWNQHAVVEGEWAGGQAKMCALLTSYTLALRRLAFPNWLAMQSRHPAPPPQHCATWLGAALQWPAPSTPPPPTPLPCLTACSSCSAAGRCTLGRMVR